MPIFPIPLLLAAQPSAPPSTALVVTVGTLVYAPATGLQWMRKGWGPSYGSISPSPPLINGYTLRSISDDIGAQTTNSGYITFNGNVPAFWAAVIIGGTRFPISSFIRSFTNGSYTEFYLKSNAKFNKFGTDGTKVDVTFEY